MAYFQSLVHLGVFKTVQNPFLPIGHTHADIDQTFSSISTHLKINDAETLPDLLSELEKCYAGRVTASQLQGIINYSSLCEEVGCLNTVDSFSEYRYFRFVQKVSGSTASLHGSACDVKLQDSGAWSPFPTSNAEGFLKFVPSFGNSLPTVTKQLINEAEVSKCLNAAEERVKSQVKMQLLRDLQQKVFNVREERFHWSQQDDFELKGYYSGTSEDGLLDTTSAKVEETMRPDYGYNPDEFVAVATTTDSHTRFWIGRIKNVIEIDCNGFAKRLTIRWYLSSGENPWEGKYTPAWKTVDGEETLYEDDIEVASVLGAFRKPYHS